MHRLNLIAFFFSVFFAVGARADWLVEPFLNYESNSFTEIPKTTLIEQTYEGTNAALGLSFSYIFSSRFYVGLSAQASSVAALTLKNSNINYSTGSAGLVLGYEVNRWRFEAGYNASQTLSLSPGTKLEEKFSGTSVHALIGYMIFNYVSLNLNYSVYDFSKINAADIKNTFKSVDCSAYGLGISFPYIF